MKETNTIQVFIEYLIDNGYPSDSIIEGYKIGKQTLDLAIINLENDELIGIFEFRYKRKKSDELNAINYLKNASKNITDYPFQLHLVYSKDEPPFFNLFYLTNENGQNNLFPIYKIPSYESLKSGSSVAKKNKQSKKEKRTFDFFKTTCWILAFSITVLLIFDFFDYLKITPERIGIIAIIIGLIIVPSAKKLNILGLEFERLRNEDKGK